MRFRSGASSSPASERFGGGLRLVQHVHAAEKVLDVHFRQTVLARAEKVTGAAQLQIGLRDLKAVVRAREHAQPLPGFFRRRIGHEHAVALRLAAPDASAQLVELR